MITVLPGLGAATMPLNVENVGGPLFGREPRNCAPSPLPEGSQAGLA